MKKLILLLALLGTSCITQKDLEADFQACRNRCVSYGAETFMHNPSVGCFCGGSLP